MSLTSIHRGNYYRAFGATLGFLLFLSSISWGQAEHCVAVPAAPVVVDGILTGAGIAPGGGPTGGGACSADAGWNGVVADTIPVVGTPDTQLVNLFISGHSGGGNLNKLFVGVHVQKAPNLSTNDHVTLYFHFGAGGTLASPDFALTYAVGADPGTPDATPTDSQCNKDIATLTYYTFSGGNWVAQNTFSAGAWSSPGATPDGKIITKKAWDFNPADDPEQGIWEMEFSVDLAGMGITVPDTGTGLAVGAKVFLHDAVLKADTTYYYPITLVADPGSDAPPASLGNVTDPTKLQAMKIGSACSNDVMVTSISSTDAHGQVGHFTLPAFDTSGNTTSPNLFTAKVKFFNPNNAGDSSPVGTANNGQVEFHLMPYNAGFLGDYPVNTPTTSFKRLNQENSIPSFVWPQTNSQWTSNMGNPSPPSSSFPGSDHVCLKVQVNGFNVNIVNGNDAQQQNLVYSHASTIKDSFLISAKRGRREQELPTEGGYIDYVLRVSWQNIGKKAGWKYTFPNAAAIGLKPIGRGYYRMRLKPNEERRVQVILTGGAMPGSVTKLMLDAKAGGKLLNPASGAGPAIVPVKEGKVVTIVANGLIRTNNDVRPNNANGFGLPEQAVTGAPAKYPPMLLQSGYYDPEQHIGAVIGSFDGFKTAFVVGTDSTFLVPKGATKLLLAINDQAGAYNDNTGRFEVNIHQSDPLVLPTAIGQEATVKEGIPVLLQAGSTLPKLDIDVMQMFAKEKLRPTGYVSWAIYDSDNRVHK